MSRAENLDASSVVQAVTEYLYDKAGNLTTVQKRTPGGSVIANTAIVNTYDRLGRRLTTTDQDLGAGANGRVDFVYDSLGDLRRQQTPRLRAQSATLYTEFDYDKLGRMTVRRDPSTSLTQTVTSTFTFDQVASTACTAGTREAGIGHLTHEDIAGGGEPGLVVDYCYSPAKLGRLDNEKRVTGSVTYQTDFAYDALGRVSQVKYPATTTWPAASRYAVNYWYNPRGYLERVAEAQGSLTVLYQTVGANARGQIEKQYLGDGSRTTRSYVKGTERLAFTNAAMGASQPVQNFVYTYDGLGNVTGRGDLINSLSETFGYDALDRLTASTVTNGTGPHPVAYQYDAAGTLGNLTHKSDTSTLPSASMTYSTTARPHAVTSLNTGSATRNFTYNTNGSLLTGQVDSTTRTLTWTSDELPATVTIGTTSRTFSYGSDRQRYKQVWVSGANTRTYTYIGEHYVKEVQGSATEHKLYIFANGEPIGYVSDDGTPDTHYFHKDHLGSVTTIVVNQSWSGREKLSYDAWGRRRSGTDWWSAASTASEERGYTGHEHLDDVTLIHMNGRLLDPKLGRVISADPTVPAPLYSQGYNRYSYVYNNPLKYTDPSGFEGKPPPDVDGTRHPRHPREGIEGECFPLCAPGFMSLFAPNIDYHQNEFAFYNAEGYLSFLQQEAAAAQQAALVLAIKGPADTIAKTDQGGVSPEVRAANFYKYLDEQLEKPFFAAQFQEYVAKREAVLADIELVESDRGNYEQRDAIVGVLEGRLAGLDHKFMCSIDYCGLESVAPEMYLIGVGGMVRGAVSAAGRSLAARSVRGTVTDFIDNVTVVSRGKLLGQGTVDVRATVEGIRSGKLAARDTFRNLGEPLPPQKPGYYEEFYHPTPGFQGTGPERIIRGNGGELYYTPDHYRSFIPLN